MGAAEDATARRMSSATCTVHELANAKTRQLTYRKRTSDKTEMAVLRREAALHRYMNEAAPGYFVTLTGFCEAEEVAADGGWTRRLEITTAHPGGDFVLLRNVHPRDAARAVEDVTAALETLYREHGFVHGDAHARNVTWSPTLAPGANVRLLDLGMSLLVRDARFGDNNWSEEEMFYNLYENDRCTFGLYCHCYDTVMCALGTKTSPLYATLAAAWGVEPRLIADLRDVYVRAVRRRLSDDDDNFETNFWAAFVGADRATGRLTEEHLQQQRRRLAEEERSVGEKAAAAEDSPECERSKRRRLC
jgi:hypothetical protein